MWKLGTVWKNKQTPLVEDCRSTEPEKAVFNNKRKCGSSIEKLIEMTIYFARHHEKAVKIKGENCQEKEKQPEEGGGHGQERKDSYSKRAHQ